MANGMAAPAPAGAMEGARLAQVAPPRIGEEGAAQAEPAADHRDWLLMALASSGAAQVDMFEILRADEVGVVPDQVFGREVVENLACALQSAAGLAAQMPALLDDNRAMLVDLQAATGRFLAHWA